MTREAWFQMNSGRVCATLHLSPEKVNLLRLDVPQSADELGVRRVTHAAGTNTTPPQTITDVVF